MELLLEGRDGRKYPEVSGNQEKEEKKKKNRFFSQTFEHPMRTAWSAGL